MKFTFVYKANTDIVEVWADPPNKHLPITMICTIRKPLEVNPIIKWHVVFGMAGTITMITKFKTWKAERAAQ